MTDSRTIAENIDAADIDAVLDAIWRMTTLPFDDDDRHAISIMAIRAIRARQASTYPVKISGYIDASPQFAAEVLGYPSVTDDTGTP
jgi:hypothetical protein